MYYLLQATFITRFVLICMIMITLHMYCKMLVIISKAHADLANFNCKFIHDHLCEGANAASAGVRTGS